MIKPDEKAFPVPNENCGAGLTILQEFAKSNMAAIVGQVASSYPHPFLEDKLASYAKTAVNAAIMLMNELNNREKRGSK